MDDLVQFLRARLDEDESAARGAKPGPWTSDDGSVYATHPTDEIVSYTESADHIARHDPARVLWEVEAKRQLLADGLADQHFRNEEDHWYSCAALTDDQGDPICFDDTRAPGPCDCGRDARVQRRLRLLALPYSDHPNYREDWRP